MDLRLGIEGWRKSIKTWTSFEIVIYLRCLLDEMVCICITYMWLFIWSREALSSVSLLRTWSSTSWIIFLLCCFFVCVWDYNILPLLYKECKTWVLTASNAQHSPQICLINIIIYHILKLHIDMNLTRYHRIMLVYSGRNSRLKFVKVWLKCCIFFWSEGSNF